MLVLVFFCDLWTINKYRKTPALPPSHLKFVPSLSLSYPFPSVGRSLRRITRYISPHLLTLSIVFLFSLSNNPYLHLLTSSHKIHSQLIQFSNYFEAFTAAIKSRMWVNTAQGSEKTVWTRFDPPANTASGGPVPLFSPPFSAQNHPLIKAVKYPATQDRNQ